MKRKPILVVLGISVFLVSALAASVFFMRNQPEELPPSVFQKFRCDRLTIEHMDTDVFCRYPKYYNNPDGITYEEYDKKTDCKEFLRTMPEGITTESYRRSGDIELYHTLSVCEDPAKLDDYIQYLKDLRRENEYLKQE